ncbi:RING finger protein 38 [Plakobranchus ocellatus]|uniref:RING finger protein 38 n=1 Tax=Plakobranchus ocellatus TaxID=259542 RepID=A0AAV4DS18_9GAST|nr:RING finger protein 38 [Plakobranchus ocellatus]
MPLGRLFLELQRRIRDFLVSQSSSPYGNQLQLPRVTSEDVVDMYLDTLTMPQRQRTQHRVAIARHLAAEAEHNAASCVFCICDFEDKQLLSILPCFHEFHAECVDEWLKVRLSSPSVSR